MTDDRTPNAKHVKITSVEPDPHVYQPKRTLASADACARFRVRMENWTDVPYRGRVLAAEAVGNLETVYQVSPKP